MGTVTTVATVSYRYYEKRAKRDVIHNIHMMNEQLGKSKMSAAYLEGCSKHDVIVIALGLHAEFPEES